MDYKKGAHPTLPERAWEPERVQLCAQGLLLRAHGFRSERGFLWFAESKTKVEVVFDEALVARTLALRDDALAAAASNTCPPPLVDSPKCVRCSLAPLCLPDEQNLLRGEASQGQVRRLLPARDDALSMYVDAQGAQVGVTGDEVVVRLRGEKVASGRMIDVSDVCLMGGVAVSTPALKALVERGIAVMWFSRGGWLTVRAEGPVHKNVHLRRAQYRAADNEDLCLSVARRLVSTKIANQRTMLRRNHEAAPEAVLESLAGSVRRAGLAPDLQTLLGIEGAAAREYFKGFPGMLRAEALAQGFDLEGRNRRPPRDPVNAMLSFAYALLTKDVTNAVVATGLDPMLGYYHQPRYGRPALALDLMEEFRPIVADSAVLSCINNGSVCPDDFQVGATGTVMKKRAKEALIEAYSRRTDDLVTHPVFEYRISYRQVLGVQARLFGRYLLGEIAAYPEFRTR